MTPEQAEKLQKQEGVEMKPIENNSSEIISRANNTVKYCDDNLNEDSIQQNLKKVPQTKAESVDFGEPLDKNIDEK